MNENEVPHLNFVSKDAKIRRRLPLSPIRNQFQSVPLSPKMSRNLQISPSPLVPFEDVQKLKKPKKKPPKAMVEKPLRKKKLSKAKGDKGLITQPGPVGLASHHQLEIHVHVPSSQIEVEGNSISLEVPKGTSSYRSGERKWIFSLDEVTRNESTLTLLLQRNSQSIFAQGQRLAWLVGSEDRKVSLKFISNFFSHLFIQSTNSDVEASVAFVRDGHLYNGMDFPIGASDKKVKPKRLKLSISKEKQVKVVGLPTAAVANVAEVQSLIKHCENHITANEHIVIFIRVQTKFGEVDLQVWYMHWPERGIHCDRSLSSLMNCIRVIYENQSRKKAHIVPFRGNVMTRILRPFLTGAQSKVITQINLTNQKYKTLAQALSFCCIKSSLTGLPQTRNKFQLNRRRKRPRKQSMKKQTRKLQQGENLSNQDVEYDNSSISASVEKENHHYKPIEISSEALKYSSLPLAPARRRVLYRDEISDCSHTSVSSYRSPASIRTDSEFDNLRSILESTRRSLNDRDSEIRELRSQLGTRALAFDSLGDTLDEVTTSKAVMLQRKDSTITLMQRRISTLEQELAIMTKKHQVREDEVADLMMQSKQVIEVLVEELNLLGEKAESAQKSITSLDFNDVSTCPERTIEVWSKVRSSLFTSELEGSPKMKLHTQKVIQSLYNAMNVLLKTIQLGQQEKMVLKSHASNLEKKMLEMKENMDTLRNQLESVQSKLRESNTKANSCRNEWKDRIDNLIAENSAYKSMLEEIKSSCHMMDPNVDVPVKDKKDVVYWKRQVSREVGCLQRAATELAELRMTTGSEDRTLELKELQSYLQESEYKRGRLKESQSKVKDC